MTTHHRRMATAGARTLNATVIAMVFTTLSLAIALALIVSIQVTLDQSADMLAEGLSMISATVPDQQIAAAPTSMRR